MSGIVEYDRGNPKLPRHFKPSLKEDSYETPQYLFDQLCIKYRLFPQLDVAATPLNTKCADFFTVEDNALEQEWKTDAWMNHPHSLHAQFTEKAYQQWKKHNINIMAIFPANCCRTSYWHQYIEGQAEYHGIEGSIRFFLNGKPSMDVSRNAYMVVIWRKR